SVSCCSSVPIPKASSSNSSPRLISGPWTSRSTQSDWRFGSRNEGQAPKEKPYGAELTLRPAFPPYPAEARVNTRRQPLVVSDPLEEICQLFALIFAERR